MSKYSVTVQQFEDVIQQLEVQVVEAEARVRRMKMENDELRRYIKDYRINLQRALDSLEPPSIG